jgi:putative ABC transport system permease protein
MLPALRQIVAVTLLNLRAVPQRVGASLTTLLGVAGVVGVFVAVLSIGEGFRQTVHGAGSPDTAIVLRTGSDSEMMSALEREATVIISQAPGVQASDQGPLASAELFVIIDLPKLSTGTSANVPLRGVQANAREVRPHLELVEGRWFEPGTNEIVVGRAASRQFQGLTLGSALRVGHNDWRVVGIFEAGGALWESEIWCDAAVLQPAYRRGDSFQTVVAKLDSEASYDGFKDSLTRDRRLEVQVQRESEFYAKQSEVMIAIINSLGTVIAGMMAIGAVFGGVLTMHSAVSARMREIATLRAVGFGAAPVVISVLVESLLLSLAGGALGAAAAWLAFDGFVTSTLNFQTFSQVAFAFAVTPALVLQGLAIALFVGLAGGALPAWRAARLPISSALREL